MSYKDKINFKIEAPYICTTDDNEVISQGVQKKLKWGKAHYSSYKTALRKHLRKEQNSRCGFCRLRVKVSQFYSHLEHLISKSWKPEFEFESKNLVFSCQRCNFGKGVTKTLSDETISVFPQESKYYNIINPYYDNFLDYIEVVEDLIFRPKGLSKKGKNTIDFYKLNRIELAEDRAFELKIIDNNITKEQLSEKLLRNLTKYNDLKTLELLENIIDEIDCWTIDD